MRYKPSIEEPAHRNDTEVIASWMFDIHTREMDYSEQLPVIYDLEAEKVSSSTIVQEIIHRTFKEDLPKVEEAMTLAVTSREYTDLIFRITNQKGEIRYIRTINGHLKDDRYLFGTTVDVTDRVTSSVHNRQGAILDLAEKSLDIGFIVIDFVHQTLEITSGIFDVLGLDRNLSPEEVWNQLLSIISPEDRKWCQNLRRIFQDVDTKHERTILFQLDSNCQKYIRIRFNSIEESNQRMILFEDISEEYLTRFELERNRMFLRLGGAAANVGGYVREIVTNELSVSEQIISMFDLESVDHVRPEHIMMRVHPEDKPLVVQCYEKTISEEPVEQYEFRIIVRERDIRWIRHQINYEDNGRFISGTFLDITEEVTRRQSLEATNKEIEQLMYSVSHDLRAPVRHIASFAHLLKGVSKNALTKNEQEYLDNILSASGKLASMLDKLLEFSKTRHQPLNKTWLSTSQLVEDCIRLFKMETLERQISWSVGELPKVFGHQEMIEGVFQNLISNAVKFTKNRELPVIRIHGKEHEKQVVISIEDNGAGFDMIYADKLFKLFERLHDAEDFEGTGFGLASVQQIIKRHGGRIWAEGTPGVGAAFHFSLPIS